MAEVLTIGSAHISPVWLNKKETIKKVLNFISDAKSKGCDLVAFSEAFIPGYPFWNEALNGCQWGSKAQHLQDIYQHYVKEAVSIKDGDLDEICHLAKSLSIVVVLGTIERGTDRGGTTVYCSAVYIDNLGSIQSVHRKLMPTFDERLVWGTGDGHGLVTHQLKGFTVSVLNCWENWMPLPRAAMYAQGTTLHIALWPGGDHNTKDITRFIALEGRTYVLSVGATMTKEDITSYVPHSDLITEKISEDVIENGGTCLAGPDGKWIIEPQTDIDDKIFVGHINLARVREMRLTFDPAGHYSRPDVTKLIVNRQRQSTVEFQDT